MYELVNTSLPNGLIPGTHGFATVAMTKGMPDAIRTRVENFCAYPHRTSAHDRTYFTENPVNWFYLALPNGDRVAGRTAPADFDYTGRTNRISRILVFGAQEKTEAGGAAVLASEAQRLSMAWTGEPRYLEADKTTVGKLLFLTNDGNQRCANWIRLLGESGAMVARRFAALLVKNVQTGGKSIYFKATTAWDASGEKMLCLIEELIALLPKEIAREVTFSTFAPCVPNGVTCHIRCVFDKDRQFDVAAAHSPWLDCASAAVVNEGMLPEPIALKANPPPVATAVIGSARTQLGTTRNQQPGGQARPSQRVGDLRRLQQPRKSDDKTFYIVLIASAVLVLLTAIGAAWWWMRNEEATRKARDAELLKAKEEERHEQELEEQREIDEAEERKKRDEEERRKIAAEEEAKRKAAEAAEKAEQEQKAKEEAEKSKQKEEAARTEPPPQAEATNVVENIAVKFPEKLTGIICGDENFLKLLGAKIGMYSDKDILKSDKDILKKEVSDKDVEKGSEWKPTLTNAGDVVIWFAKSGKVEKMETRIAIEPKRAVGKTVYEGRIDDMGIDQNSSWIVWQVPSMDVAYWEWKSPYVGKVFEKDDKVNLKDVIASRITDGKIREVYKNCANDLSYRLFNKNGSMCFDGEVSINELLSKDEQKLNTEVNKLDAEIQAASNKLSEIHTASNRISGIIADIKKHKANIKKIESEKGSRKDKDAKIKNENDGIDAIEKNNENITLFEKYDLPTKVDKEKSKRINADNEIDIMGRIARTYRTTESSKKNKEKEREEMNQKIKLLDNTKLKRKHDEYKIEVLPRSAKGTK